MTFALLSPSVFRRALPLFLAVSGRLAQAQLLGCDAVNCPGTQDRNPLCTIGNVTAKSLGIANLTTVISQEPLTWTLAETAGTDPANNSQEIWSRDFFLGTPPDLNLQTTTVAQGCALIFDAITADLTFPYNHEDRPIGTCSDALSSGCVSDLILQAQSTLTGLTTSITNVTAVCQVLEGVLRDSAPRSCNVTQNRSWGSIHVRDLTGPTSQAPLQQSDCHPTTGQNYSISHVDSYSITGTNDELMMGDFLAGVTPIMTIFFSDPQNTGSLSAPELSLTCLSPVMSEVGCVGCGSGQGTSDTPGSSNSIGVNVQLVVAAAVAVGALMWI